MKKNYLVTYAYIADNGQVGAIKDRRMSLDEIDFLFKAISVGNCREWIASVRSLRRGSSAMIRSGEKSEAGTTFLKGFSIRRV